MSRSFVALPIVLAVWGCSDFTEDLSDGNYQKNFVSSLDELTSHSCTSKNEGEIIIMSNPDKVSFSYQCEDGKWVGDEGDEVAVKKSSDSKASSSSKAKSSNSAKEESSSSVLSIDDISSSSRVVLNGMSEPALGVCAPVDGSTTIGKGTSVAFKFTADGSLIEDPALLTTATYEWDYGDFEISEDSENGRTSSKVLFSSSGDHKIHVIVSIGDKVQTVACLVHVNGVPISGCSCNSDAKVVNYQETPEVTWSVSGCRTEAASLTYAWDGRPAGDDVSYTKTFNEPRTSYAPVLTVNNSDNTQMEVLCPGVKVTEGAEYQMDGHERVEFPAGDFSVLMTAPKERCTDSFGADFYCSFEGGDYSIMVVDGEEYEVSYFHSVDLPCDKATGDYSLSLRLSAPALCSLMM